MTLFSLLESLFFMSLALSFFLIFLMVYHFKKRIDSLDRKNETLGGICKTLIKEIDLVKETKLDFQSQNMCFSDAQSPFPFKSFSSQENLNPLEHLFKQLKAGHQNPEHLEFKIYGNEILDDVEYLEEDGPVYEILDIEDEPVFEILSEIDDKETDIFMCLETKMDEEPLEEYSVTEHLVIEPVTIIPEIEMAESVVAESVVTNTEDEYKLTKKNLNKMTVQMLRNLAMQEGFLDPSKMKKKELLEILIDEKKHGLSTSEYDQKTVHEAEINIGKNNYRDDIDILENINDLPADVIETTDNNTNIDINNESW